MRNDVIYGTNVINFTFEEDTFLTKPRKLHMHNINSYDKLVFSTPTLVYSFFNYILLIMLLQLSQFSLPPVHQVSPTPSGNPTPLFMSMGHAYKFIGYYMSCTVLYIPMAIL